MKRVLTLFCLLATLLIASVSHAASSYEEYYNGDRNYPIIWGRMGTAWYLDRSSLTCEDYNPPYCILVIDVFSVSESSSGNQKISQAKPMRFIYDLNDLEIYTDRNTGFADDWRYLSPTGSNAESGLPMYVGEAAYYINFGKKFYGSRTWYDSSIHKNMSVFSDSFYAKF